MSNSIVILKICFYYQYQHKSIDYVIANIQKQLHSNLFLVSCWACNWPLYARSEIAIKYCHHRVLIQHFASLPIFIYLSNHMPLCSILHTHTSEMHKRTLNRNRISRRIFRDQINI